MNISFIAGLTQRLIVVCLVSVILWHVTHDGATPHGKATVYLPREDDILIIDGRPYPIESTAKPVVCDLKAGKHVLQVRHGQFTIAEEEFRIEPGRAITLAPRVPDFRGKLTAWPRSNPEATNSSDPAIRTTQPQPTQNRAAPAPTR